MPVSLREAAKIAGIHYKTLADYVKKGFLHPKIGVSCCRRKKYLFSQADIDRALEIYAYHQQNIRLKHPNLSAYHQQTREKRLAAHGQSTNRVGRAPLAT